MKYQNLLQLEYRGTLSDYVRAIAWSPDAEILAATSATGEVVLWRGSDARSATPEAYRLILLQSGEDLSVECLDFSYDGQFLAVGGQDGKVKVWCLQAEEPLLVATIDNGSAWIDRLVWSPVTNLLAFGVGRRVSMWDANTQAIVTTLNFESSSVLDLAWHPEGKYLAVSGHGGVKVWQTEDFDATPYLLQVPGASICTAWSRDGKYLASGNLDRTLSVMEWDSELSWLMRGFPGKVSKIAWSELVTETGAPIIAAACAEVIAIWYQEEPTEENWQFYLLEQHQGFVRAIAFQSDTFLLASAADDGFIYLWEGAQNIVETVEGAKGGFSCLAWDNRGEKLAAGGQEGELFIMQTSPGATLL